MDRPYSEEKQALDWHPQGAEGEEGRSKPGKMTVLQEEGKCSKARCEVKRLAVSGVIWRCCTNAACS
jgi:hypothetical protein